MTTWFSLASGNSLLYRCKLDTDSARFTQETLPQHTKKVYVFNTYFYSSLTNGCKGRKNINYDAVKRWTSKIDLFSYDYVIVPINERYVKSFQNAMPLLTVPCSYHWYVAIICNLSKIGKSLERDTSDGEMTNTMNEAINWEPSPSRSERLFSDVGLGAEDNGDERSELLSDYTLEAKTSKMSLDALVDGPDAAYTLAELLASDPVSESTIITTEQSHATGNTLATASKAQELSKVLGKTSTRKPPSGKKYTTDE